jgi:hypothetical protein
MIWIAAEGRVAIVADQFPRLMESMLDPVGDPVRTPNLFADTEPAVAISIPVGCPEQAPGSRWLLTDTLKEEEFVDGSDGRERSDVTHGGWKIRCNWHSIKQIFLNRQKFLI